jgi:hypothetical protein
MLNWFKLSYIRMALSLITSPQESFAAFQMRVKLDPKLGELDGLTKTVTSSNGTLDMERWKSTIGPAKIIKGLSILIQVNK